MRTNRQINVMGSVAQKTSMLFIRTKTNMQKSMRKCKVGQNLNDRTGFAVSVFVLLFVSFNKSTTVIAKKEKHLLQRKADPQLSLHVVILAPSD